MGNSKHVFFFSRTGVDSTSPNPQAGGPPLVGCPRLLIQFIHSYPPYRRPFLHPQQLINTRKQKYQIGTLELYKKKKESFRDFYKLCFTYDVPLPKHMTDFFLSNKKNIYLNTCIMGKRCKILICMNYYPRIKIYRVFYLYIASKIQALFLLLFVTYGIKELLFMTFYFYATRKVFFCYKIPYHNTLQ